LDHIRPGFRKEIKKKVIYGFSWKSPAATFPETGPSQEQLRCNADELIRNKKNTHSDQKKKKEAE